MKKIMLWLLAAILAIICCAGVMTCRYCKNNNPNVATQYTPQAPDYADTTMWITEDGDTEGTGADVPVIAATCMGINPVNWRTDATPATLHDTITVTLAPEYHFLLIHQDFV